MDKEPAHRKTWFGHLMMVVSILVVCVGIPMAFVFSSAFSNWLESAGVHPNPNLAGGYPIAHCDRFVTQIVDSLPAGDSEMLARALAIRRFTLSKVEFRPLSGIGIAPRLNLSFDFAGQLPDPQNSSWKFSLTTIHVYIKAPGRNSPAPLTDKAAQVDFGGKSWDYEVVIDGLHDQACIYDTLGNLIGRGLALYVDYQYPAERGNKGGSRKPTSTRITAALPLYQFGDPAKGVWNYYVLVGVADSRHPSMMLHSGPDDTLNVFSKPSISPEDEKLTVAGRPVVPPIVVSNPE